MWVMNAIYFVVLCVSLFWLRPVCQHKKTYPYVMNWAGGLFLINAIYNFVMHGLNYNLKWEGEDSEIRDHSTNKEIFGESYDKYVYKQETKSLCCCSYQGKTKVNDQTEHNAKLDKEHL